MKSLKSFLYSTMVIIIMLWVSLSCNKNDSPSSGADNTRFLVPTGFDGKDAIVFAPTGLLGAQYSLELYTRAKDPHNNCNTKDDYGKFSLTLTTCAYDVDLSKINKVNLYDFTGSFSGTIYEDHQEFIDNCVSTLPHSISGDFNLIAGSL